jgi:ubiquitin C-terminal hydrolase
MEMPEEALKKENTEVLSSILHAFDGIQSCRSDKVENFKKQFNYHGFWMLYTLKLLKCNSLVLRLYGWDQIQEILKKANLTAPKCAEYTVSGAGYGDVNGVYKMSAEDTNGFGIYVKAPTRTGMQPFTLFRCLMKSQSYFWFISFVPAGHMPGTDRDIDYYEHCSQSHENHEPQQSGWVVAMTTVNHGSLNPCPTVTRSGQAIIADGVAEEQYLCNHFKRWAAEQPDILLNAFSSSHREVLSRCSKLVLFLAEANALSRDHINLIWKTTINSSDTDIVKELISMIATACKLLNEEILAYLVDSITESIRLDEQQPSSPGTLSPSLSKASLLMEKLSKSRFHERVARLGEACATRVLALVWLVYKHPQFDQLKNKSTIQDFVSQCFGLPVGIELARKNAKECLDELQVVRSKNFADEDAITKSLHTLQFLVSKSLRPSDLVQFESNGLCDILIGEIERFVNQNNRTHHSLDWYSSELNRRLMLLHQFYELCGIKLSLGSVERIWLLCRQSSRDLNALFLFFSAVLSNRGYRNCILSKEDLLCVFENFICSDHVDWSVAEEACFDCFKKYFQVLETCASSQPDGPDVSNDAASSVLGLDTLWKVALTCRIPGVQSASTELLIKSYEDLMFIDDNAHEQFTQRVFAVIQRREDIIKNTLVSERMESAELAAVTLQVDRATDLLYQVIIKSKEPREPSHVVCGCLDTIRLNVNYRRLQQYYDISTQSNALRTEMGSEATYSIEVHSLVNLKTLKQKIAFAVGGGTAGNNVSFDGDLSSASDLSLLRDHNLRDGQEISAHSRLESHYSAVGRRTNYSLDSNVVTDVSTLPSIAEYISDDSTRFDLMLSLADQISVDCKCESSCLNRIEQKIWTIMMLLPTQAAIFGCFYIDIGQPGGAEKWKSVLDCESLARRTYLLQILDHELQPSTDVQNEEVLRRAESLRTTLLESGGVSALLDIFLSTSSDESAISRYSVDAVLHTLFFLLCGGVSEGAETSPAQLNPFEDRMQTVVGKLLMAASSAAATGEYGIVHNALAILARQLSSEAASSLLVGNPSSRTLLLAVLRNPSEAVRNLACDFAVQLGKTQPVVFDWLVAELQDVANDDCLQRGQLFSAVELLLRHLYIAFNATVDWKSFGSVVSAKILAYPTTCPSSAVESSKVLILGQMRLLETLIRIDLRELSFASIDFEAVLKTLFDSYLFTWPAANSVQYVHPICCTVEEKAMAFSLISAIVSVNYNSFVKTLQIIQDMSGKATEVVGKHWGMQPTFDLRSSEIPFLGLKNQGCTCYMSSLLQQLFMSVRFREAVLATPLRECHRSSVLHRTPAQLIGRSIVLEWPNNVWKPAKVLGFDEETGLHTIEYGPNDTVTFDIYKGRHRQELGNVRMAPVEGDEPATEREEGAYRVLDQLQRVFYFMKYSMRRSFDPRPFVDACKSLNLNFNVYQQNDASEFCDQLLDRISIAAKGKHTGVDMWTNNIEKLVFGGKFLYQKIPTDCEVYSVDKTNCGHWQSSRQESFLKIELNIKGKDNIYDSISELIAGELMDGDNKIHCEVCTQKKATVRRTCLDVLPNTLVIHLKRFDLDFTTFETVKLNTKLSFERKINMLRYTKEGIEAEEAKTSQSSADKSSAPAEEGGKSPTVKVSLSVDSSDENVAESPKARGNFERSPFDPENYEYELQGVLVHAGVAQGGHYYSYACQKNEEKGGDEEDEKWFRFDDEDVSAFNPEYIPLQCFGGSSGSQHSMDEDRIANALMLFYNKVRPIADPEQQQRNAEASSGAIAGGPAGAAQKGSRVLTGNEAFKKELQEKNHTFLTSRYSLDPSLQEFLRELMNSVTASEKHATAVKAVVRNRDMPSPPVNLLKWYPPKSGAKTGLATAQLTCKYLLNVVFHCRERAAPKRWVNVLKSCFETSTECAAWFVGHVLKVSDPMMPSYFEIFTQQCTDAVARGMFVQILVAAVSALGADLPQEALLPYLNYDDNDLKMLGKKKAPTGAGVSLLAVSLLTQLTRKMLDSLLEVPLYVRVSDELFALLREVSCVSCIRKAFWAFPIISILMFYVHPTAAKDSIRELIDSRLRQHRGNHSLEFHPLLQSVFEAIASVLGVPQMRKVGLLQDRSFYESELVPDARDAFTTIFGEVARAGHMTSSDVLMYKDRIGTKVQAQYAKAVVDRFGTIDGKLTLNGFIDYYTDLASYNPKEVWKDLNGFGFLNDLTRSRSSNSLSSSSNLARSSASSAHASTGTDPFAVKLEIQADCKKCLWDIHFYKLGMVISEPSTKAIAKRISLNDKINSLVVLRAVSSHLVSVIL